MYNYNYRCAQYRDIIMFNEICHCYCWAENPFHMKFIVLKFTMIIDIVHFQNGA